MRGIRGWVILAAVATVIAVAAFLLQPHQDSPEHSSNSDAANGSSAALLLSQAMGHQTRQITGTFDTPDAGSIMFVFTPTSPFTPEEADRTRTWVSSGGGTLVYASEQGDPELDRAFKVRRSSTAEAGGEYLAPPVIDGVVRVVGGDAVAPVVASATQVPMLRTSDGFVAGYIQQIGAGRVVVLADPLVLCNGFLEKGDNGRLLADLLGIANANVSVAFDEYHHGLTFSDFAPQAWVATPWGAGLLWLLVAVFFGLVLRGRRFGPLVERPAEVARSDVEWAVAVGQLLRRSSARAVTLGLLASATERSVAARTGLPMQPRDRFWQALWVRAPQAANELAQVESSLQSASTERDLLDAARRLHAIAHPAPGRKTR